MFGSPISNKSLTMSFVVLILAGTPAAWAGQGGSVTLVNGTDSDWKRTQQSSYQMTWNFPEHIRAGSTWTGYVEFHQGIFKVVGDDRGDVAYALEDNQSFQIYAVPFRLEVVFDNLETRSQPKGSIVPLGWRHDGCVSFILTGTKGDYVATGFNAESWMQDGLNRFGDLTLAEICLPGSHDAGMSVFTRGTIGASRCNVLTQSRSIQEQLLFGVRYFDIRPVISDSKFYAGHYSGTKVGWQGANGQSIDSIIANVNAFTDDHNELVVLNLSHTLNTDVGITSAYRPFNSHEWNQLLQLLDALKHPYFAEPDEDLTQKRLRDFIERGPAVVVVIEDKSVDLGSRNGRGFFHYESSLNAYNRYSNTNKVGSMVSDQLAKMKANSGSRYFLLSWTLTQDGWQASTCQNLRRLNSASIKDLAHLANQELPDRLFKAVPAEGFPNIIYTDEILDSESAVMSIALIHKRLASTVMAERVE